MKNKFPDAIQCKAVFAGIEDAKEKIINERKRHFIKNDELITLEDGAIIAVSNQWGDDSKKGLGNIKPFIKKA